MSDLKPCPFCGCPPVISGYPEVEIVCENCRQLIVKVRWYGGHLGLAMASWNILAESPLNEELSTMPADLE